MSTASSRVRRLRVSAPLLFGAFVSVWAPACGSIGERSEKSSSTESSCAPTLSSIQENVFARHCSAGTCHGGDNPAAMLDLGSGDARAALVEAPSQTCPGWLRVAVGSPEDSLLWQKVSGEITTCGERMPIGGRLSERELSCLRQWIAGLGPSPPGQGCETCGGALCVDLSTDTTHCGTCDSVCPSGASCVDGQCSCAGGLAFCDGQCVDTASNLSHCGACRAPCPPGAVCTAGKCLCPGTLEACTSGCADTQSDPAHCGLCESACDTSLVCLLGGCASACGTFTQCGASCVDTMSNAAHCGGCSQRCPLGANCTAGQCECPAGTGACNGVCIDTTNDPNNCGGCDTACSGGLVCQGGACRCPGGGIPCGTRCVDAATDSTNCGSCGVVCGAGQACVNGTCACTATGSVSFSADVQPIFAASCAFRGCHSETRPREGLDLTAVRAYTSLVGVPATQCADRLRVAPGDPSASYLMHKIMGANLCFGTLMPKSDQPLLEAQVDTIGAWICAGAPNN